MSDLKLPDEIRTLILKEPSRFLQCGSRWFASRYPDLIQITEYTDYDFYCEHTDSNQNYLEEIGFRRVDVHPNYPLDDLAVNIFIAEDVQVITRSDTSLYSKVILSISPEFYRDFLWKSGPKTPSRDQIQSIFNQLFKTAK